MRRLILLVCLSATAFTVLLPRSNAQSCSAGHDNMLDWMGLDTATSQHLNGPQSLPPYTVLPANNVFWWLKGSSGYPWDEQYYDSTYIYQWITDAAGSWTDPTTYKAFASKTGMKWAPICVPQGVPGQRLSSIAVPSANTAYNVYATGCVKGATQYLGNTVNEVWNYGNLNIGGTIGTQPDLQLSYRYSCDSSYNNCTYKEVYDLMKNYGLVQWTYYKLINGTYVQQNQTTFNQVVSGGAPAPDFPCPHP